jgi:hypothetical protein
MLREEASFEVGKDVTDNFTKNTLESRIVETHKHGPLASLNLVYSTQMSYRQHREYTRMTSHIQHDSFGVAHRACNELHLLSVPVQPTALKTTKLNSQSIEVTTNRHHQTMPNSSRV